MSTIICSCGKEFHSNNRSSTANVRHHLRKNPGHREILRFSFKDPRKMEVIYKSEDRYMPIPGDLAKAMAYLYSREGTILKEEDLRDTAVQVMQFFGFEREVVGNHLEQDEIALMYQLEDAGLVDTRIEEYNLLDGNPWRVNYFILNVKRIRKYSSKEIESNLSDVSQVYQDLPEEAWVR